MIVKNLWTHKTKIIHFLYIRFLREFIHYIYNFWLYSCYTSFIRIWRIFIRPAKITMSWCGYIQPYLTTSWFVRKFLKTIHNKKIAKKSYGKTLRLKRILSAKAPENVGYICIKLFPTIIEKLYISYTEFFGYTKITRKNGCSPHSLSA